eukprot:800417_1
MASGPPKAKQTRSPFGKKPEKLKVNNKKYVDLVGSGNQSPSGWVTVKSTAYDNNTKPKYTYSTNKPPKQYNIKPKNKQLPDKSFMKTYEVKSNEPNAYWHSNPKQDPTATVCGVCTKKFQNSSITVNGYKIHRGCFKCSKCKKTLNHKSSSSY